MVTRFTITKPHVTRIALDGEFIYFYEFDALQQAAITLLELARPIILEAVKDRCGPAYREPIEAITRLEDMLAEFADHE